MQCREDGCQRTVKARGLCGTHYWKKICSGELKRLAPSEMNQDKRNGEWYECSACRARFYRTPGETEFSRGNGFYCSPACWYKRNAELQCSVEGCASPPRGQGFCKKHYARFRRYGDPLITKHEPNGSPNIKRYRKRRIGGRITQEHTYVAEQLLGRRLQSGENLHHRNGLKLDNRPDNLILFPTMSAHRQYENRYREYLEMCIREGYLVWAKEPPSFELGGILLSELSEAGT